MHSGSLTAYSEGEGYGSSFFLEVPVGHLTVALMEDIERQGSVIDGENEYHVVEGEDRFMPLSSVGGDESISATVGRRVTNILCVDDSMTSRKITVRMLVLMGYKCFEACDGDNCLKVFDALTQDGVVIDAILMDFEMPRMNGPTATQELKKRGCTCPIIGITGNVMAADKKIFFDSGASEVLAKPLSMDLLEAAFTTYYTINGSMHSETITTTNLEVGNSIDSSCNKAGQENTLDL